MWKKFLALSAAIAMFASLMTVQFSAMADEPLIPATPLIDSVTVTPEQFNPASAHSVIGILLNSTSLHSASNQITIKITDPNHTDVFNQSYTNWGTYLHNVIWYGRTGNLPNGSILSDGKYTIKVSAIDTGSSSPVTSIVTRYVTIDSVSPSVSNLQALPAAFNPQTGGYTQVSFTTNESAYLTAKVVYGSTIIYNVPSFPGTFISSAGNHSFNWYGRNNAGSSVATGGYIVQITSKDKSNNTKTTSTSVSVQNATDFVSDLTLSPSSRWNPKNEGLRITFDILNNVQNLIIQARRGNETIQIFRGYNFGPQNNYSLYWDGKDDNNNYVDSGSWEIRVVGEYPSDMESDSITVDYSPGDDDDDDDTEISDVQFDPDHYWDPKDEELKISFDINEYLDHLTVEAIRGSKTVNIKSALNVNAKNNYTVYWDGRDSHNDYVTEGNWSIRIDSDTDVHTDQIVIDYSFNGDDDDDDDDDDDNPQISKPFVTKSSFDPDEKEFVNLGFRVIDDDAKVDVDMYHSSTKEFNLVKNKFVKKDKWFSVKWDGKDEDDDIVSNSSSWKFKITLKDNDGDIMDTEYVSVTVGEESNSSNIPDLYKDSMEPVIFDRDENTVKFHYCIDDDADDVIINVYEGPSATGDLIKEVFDKGEDEGCYTQNWDGRDDDNDKLTDNTIYSYKIIAESEDGDMNTEIGKFAVGDATSGGSNTDCNAGDYRDLYNISDEMCDAIDWAYENKIMTGYSDGTFKPFNYVNRAEVLRVILEAFEANLLRADGTNLGFWDLDPNGWYMTYARTAQSDGLLDGNPDGTARLDYLVNRAEILKFALEGAEEYADYDIPNADEDSMYDDVDDHDWFFDYAGVSYEFSLLDDKFGGDLRPADYVLRGEAALMLYRMNKDGLLN